MMKSLTKNLTQQFSDPIFNYILKEIPPYIGVVMLQADDGGLIRYWHGSLDRYFDQQPTEGQPIEDYAPFLFGMVPPLINPMVISHVLIKEKVYVEVHILNDDENNTWVILIDQSKEVELIHPIIQYYNEEKLKSTRDNKQASTVKGTLSALYLLDYLTFEREKDGYRFHGITPFWFDQLNKKLYSDDQKIDLIETFPYIEVFQIEAEEIWSSQYNGKVISGLWEETNKNGTHIYLQALALRNDKRNYLLIKPSNQENGMSDGFIQKAREQKLTLDQLANAERKLKQLLGFKDQFVSIISHDLRSPIGAVIGLSELLLTDEDLINKLDEQQLELLTDIKNEMLRLLDYNDKLYQWSNLELGNFKITKKPVSPLNLANYVEKMQSAKLKKKNITFEKKIDSDCSFQADETLLGQAINNLVGNSVKFTPEGGTISLHFSYSNGQNSIIITDSGMGMDKDTCERLFSGFTRKTTMGTFGEKGTGLGLGIVKKILDAHEFTINVDSVLGKGTSFTIVV